MRQLVAGVVVFRIGMGEWVRLDRARSEGGNEKSRGERGERAETGRKALRRRGSIMTS